MKFNAAAILSFALVGLSAAASVPMKRAAVADIAEVGAKIAEIILEGKAADDETRGRFAQNMIDGFRREYGDNSNIVVIHTGHDYTWDGVQGSDWAHSHYELDVQIGGTIGYELYVSKVSGYLHRTGDGGGLNWAWYGFLAKDPEDNGALLTFVDPDA